MKFGIRVGGVEHFFFTFPKIGNFILPTDEVIFVREVARNHQPDGDLVDDLMVISWSKMDD